MTVTEAPYVVDAAPKQWVVAQYSAQNVSTCYAIDVLTGVVERADPVDIVNRNWNIRRLWW